MVKTVTFNLLELPNAADGSNITVKSYAYGMEDSSDYSNAESYSVGDISYTLSADGEYYIVNGIGTFSQPQLMIPSEHLGKPVKEIAPNAFMDVLSLYKVFIPETVTYIGSGAFKYCGNLLEVRFDSAIEDGIRVWLLTDNTYSNIKMQYRINGSTIWEEQEIGVYFTQGTSQFYSGFCPFDAEWIRFVGTHTSSGKVCISDEIHNSKISENACWETDINLTGKTNMGVTKSRTQSVYDAIDNQLPYSASLTIGSGAFLRCYSLNKVVLPRRLKEIGDSAFQDCAYLTDCLLPYFNSLESIGMGAFENCKRLGYFEPIKENTFDKSGTNLKTIGVTAFRNTDLGYIRIPDSVETIGSSAFADCANVESITFGESVRTIESALCQNCTILSEVNIGNGVQRIGNKAFKGCTSLIQIEIPANVIWIGKEAFADCTTLEEVYFEDVYGWFMTKESTPTDYTSHLTPDDEMSVPNHLAEQLKRYNDQDLGAHNLFNLNKLPAPTITVTGDTLRVTDPTGLANLFEIYVNGVCRATLFEDGTLDFDIY